MADKRRDSIVDFRNIAELKTWSEIKRALAAKAKLQRKQDANA